MTRVWLHPIKRVSVCVEVDEAGGSDTPRLWQRFTELRRKSAFQNGESEAQVALRGRGGAQGGCRQVRRREVEEHSRRFRLQAQTLQPIQR